MTKPVELSTAEMWELSRVGACILLAVQDMDENSPGRNRVVEAGNRLFELMNKINERDDWEKRSPIGEESETI